MSDKVVHIPYIKSTENQLKPGASFNDAPMLMWSKERLDYVPPIWDEELDAYRPQRCDEAYGYITVEVPE